MKSLFLLDRADLLALRSGDVFEIHLANGAQILLQAESAWTKRRPIVRSPKPSKRRVFSPRQKARILKEAEQGVSQAARHHQLSRSVIDRWRREKAAA